MHKIVLENHILPKTDYSLDEFKQVLQQNMWYVAFFFFFLKLLLFEKNFIPSLFKKFCNVVIKGSCTSPRKTLGRMDISPNVHFPELTLARMYIWPNGHFPDGTFSRMDTWQNVHLAEWTFPRKPIFQSGHLQ